MRVSSSAVRFVFVFLGACFCPCYIVYRLSWWLETGFFSGFFHENTYREGVVQVMSFWLKWTKG